jgi:hypothetical protein
MLARCNVPCETIVTPSHPDSLEVAMLATTIAALLIGAGLISFGIYVIVNRRTLAKRTSENQRSRFGALGQSVAKSNTPTVWVGAAAMAIFIGLITFIPAIVALLGM